MLEEAVRTSKVRAKEKHGFCAIKANPTHLPSKRKEKRELQGYGPVEIICLLYAGIDYDPPVLLYKKV